MHRLRSSRRPFRRLAAWALLCAMALRALVPPGFMPDFTALAEGAFPIVICSGGLERTILLDRDGNPIQPADPDGSKAPCLFALLGSVALPLLLLLVLLAPEPAPEPRPRRLQPPQHPARPPGTAGPRAPPLPA